MHFRILGPLEALDGGRSLPLGGSKQRALLAVLLLHANETLSTDRLIDELWGERPPATAAKTVQVHVSRLRKALGDGAGNGSVGLLVTREHGYELQLDRERLDSHRFERLVAEGRSELAGGRPARAVSALEQAFSLWRGPPLVDLAYEPFAQREIARLDDLQVAAFELLIEAKLELGRHAEVVPQLETLIAQHPYRERLNAQLMLALYRSDRQADALQAYQDARRKLVDELGIEPGERLRDLERAILAHDPALASPAVEAVELPPELDASTLLAGREADLEWLRQHWRRAQAGAVRLVLLAGPRGMGKTRLAAELAGEVHRDGGAVRYASGAEAPKAARALAGAPGTPRPTLFVLDDIDRARDELWAALRELLEALAGLPALVLATAEDPSLAPRLGADATLTLEPLDAGGVRAVAELYAGAHDDVAIPLERLAAASGGVPQRVHRAAGEWARAEAARRLGAAAGRAASERTGLRAAEEELAGRVVDLQAVNGRAESEERDARAVVCPFKGLASFDVEDAELFFGRERLVAEMVARLTGAPLMGIVGPSGSGKSSALRAGLLAALAGGVLPGSERWALALFRPGEHPLQALEQATAAAASRDPLIVAVDQFEEAFAMCRDESERGAFIDALVSCARYQRRPAVVLIAVRADFYGRCAAYPELSLLLGASHVLVGPMRRDELRRAIELPARRAGLRVEEELVDALVADVEGQPGALPLLSTSLLELWQRRDGRRLRMSAYQHAGGVHGAVARLAESAYQRLDPDRRRLARRILLRLAGEGEGEAVVRRRVPLAELQIRDDRVAEVVAGLARERLVTIGDGEVEVAHEALLREWPRLRGWLEEDAEGRRLHLHLGAAAGEWDAGGRDASELYRGARLASALDWSIAHPEELNASERAFLDESRAASERSTRRLRAVLAGVAALLALAVIAGLVALQQRGNARDEAVAADAQRLGAQALVEDELDRALLLARQGVALHDSLQTRSNLLAALLKSPAAIGVLRGGGNRLTSLDLSPDGRTLAFLDDDATLRFIDTRTRRPVAQRRVAVGADRVIGSTVPSFAAQAFGSVVEFSDDGSLLAVGGGQQPLVMDARTHRVLARLVTYTLAYRLRFSPDGRTVFAAIGGPQQGSTSIQRFAARSGRPLGPERYVSRGPAPVSLMPTRDGRHLVTSSEDTHTVIRDARTLRPLKRLPFYAAQAALSPSDRTMLVGGRDGSVRFVDLVSGTVRTASGRHDGAVVRTTFSTDGRTAVTTAEDNRAIVWNVERATAEERLEGHAGQITGLEISRDGKTLYTAALDGTVLIWDVGDGRRLGRPFDLGRENQAEVPRRAPSYPAPSEPILSYAMRPDGRVLAAGHDDGTVTLVDAGTLRALSTFRAVPHGPVRGIAYTPGGRMLVVGGENGFLALVEPGSGRLVARLPGHQGTVLTPSFSANGRLMAILSSGDTVQLRSLRSGRPRGRLASYGTSSSPTGVSLSPDGRTLALTTGAGVELVDAATLRPSLELPGTETVRSLQFTPDGRFLVGGSSEGWARLWSTETWRPATRALAGHTGEVLWHSTSPDGHTLATGSTDGTIRLFDLRTQQPLGAPLRGLHNRPVAPQFTPNGAHLFAITDAGRAYRWDVRPSSWARHACAVAGRQLTRTEWADALPERDYNPAC